MKLFTINELLTKYPFVQEELGWSKEDIQVFYDSHLLLGEYKNDLAGEIDSLHIDEGSFLKLIEYHRSVQKMKNGLKNHQD